MIEFIRNINGPVFLLIYIIISILVIYVAKKISENDNSKDFDIPEPTKLSPLDLALLRKGVKGAIFVSLISLWRKHKISISKNKNFVIVTKLIDKDNDLNILEKEILNKSSEIQYFKNFFKIKSVNYFADILKDKIESLQQMNLLSDEFLFKKQKLIFFVSLTILLITGGLKLYLGILNDKPVGFLIVLMLTALVVNLLILKPRKIKLTALGKKLISASSQRFEWVKKKQSSDKLMNDDNLFYAIALFGIAPFAATQIGRSLTNLGLNDASVGLSSPLMYGSYTNSGCGGTGCSGSSCGGTSCSGSSCGGGGCGGCGSS